MQILLSTRRQHGAAALIVVLVMLFAMTLVATFANRNLLFEQRSSANQYRSTQAFEAAEAGIEWALAQLNANQRIGADCRPGTDLAATSFRSRHLSIAAKTGALTPTTWTHAGVATPLQASCTRAGAGWSCSCPAQGLPNLPAPTGATPAAAFTVQFAPAGQPGVVRLVANGCTSLAGACLTGSTGRADASARIEVALGLVAGLRTPPAATVTTRAGFDAGSAALGLHNADPSTGIAVHAGGAIDAALARLTPPAGAATTGLLAANDAALAALPVDRFFASYFGVDKAAWQTQPAVTRISCTADCAAALAAALDATADAALIQVDGDLLLAGPITLGSVERPVAIIVTGTAQFDGAVGLNGLLYAAAVRWNSTAGAAFVRGALISEGGYQGNGAPEFFYDPLLLDTLRHTSGSFARINGSWRDF
ncbi:MAG: pilus assembly PilX N-terminal domain-containing protein [Pseudomonadota bacterium]